MGAYLECLRKSKKANVAGAVEVRRGYKTKLERLPGPDQEVPHRHGKNFGLDSRCDGKPLESFDQGTKIIRCIF